MVDNNKITENEGVIKIFSRNNWNLRWCPDRINNMRTCFDYITSIYCYKRIKIVTNELNQTTCITVFVWPKSAKFGKYLIKFLKLFLKCIFTSNNKEYNTHNFRVCFITIIIIIIQTAAQIGQRLSGVNDPSSPNAHSSKWIDGGGAPARDSSAILID